jgi:hypothetical protein
MEMSAKKSFAAQKNDDERANKLAEFGDMQGRIRDLNRRNDELVDDVRALEEQNLELKAERGRLQL